MTDNNIKNNSNDALSFLPPKEADRASLLIAKLQIGNSPMKEQLPALMELQSILYSRVPPVEGHYTPELIKKMVAGYGIIEEVIEYLNSVGFKSWRPKPLPRDKQLEEIVDQLFFYLEMVLFSGFSMEEVVDGYVNKWYENISRYKKLSEGDTSWDKRMEKDGP